MEYKLPPLPATEYMLGIPARPYEPEWMSSMEAYDASAMIQYAEQAVAPLLSEIERLKRGEFICNKCYLRKDAEVGTPDF